MAQLIKDLPTEAKKQCLIVGTHTVERELTAASPPLASILMHQSTYSFTRHLPNYQ